MGVQMSSINRRDAHAPPAATGTAGPLSFLILRRILDNLKKAQLTKLALVSKAFHRLAYSLLFQDLHLHTDVDTIDRSYRKDGPVLLREHLFLRKFDDRSLLAGQDIRSMKIKIRQQYDPLRLPTDSTQAIQSIIQDLGWIGSIHWDLLISRTPDETRVTVEEYIKTLSALLSVADLRTSVHHVTIDEAIYLPASPITHAHKLRSTVQLFKLPSVHTIHFMSGALTQPPTQLASSLVHPTLRSLRLDRCCLIAEADGADQSDHGCLIRALSLLPGIRRLCLNRVPVSLRPKSAGMLDKAHYQPKNLPVLAIEQLQLLDRSAVRTLEHFTRFSNLNSLQTMALHVDRVHQQAQTLAGIVTLLPSLRRLRLIETAYVPDGEPVQDEEAAFRCLEDACSQRRLLLEVVPTVRQCLTGSDMTREMTRLKGMEAYLFLSSCFVTVNALSDFEYNLPAISSPTCQSLGIEIYSDQGQQYPNLVSSHLDDFLAIFDAPNCTYLALCLVMNKQEQIEATKGLIKSLRKRRFPNLQTIKVRIITARTNIDSRQVLPCDSQTSCQEFVSVCDALSIEIEDLRFG